MWQNNGKIEFHIIISLLLKLNKKGKNILINNKQKKVKNFKKKIQNHISSSSSIISLRLNIFFFQNPTTLKNNKKYS
jgi:hypothetical protein